MPLTGAGSNKTDFVRAERSQAIGKWADGLAILPEGLNEADCRRLTLRPFLHAAGLSADAPTMRAMFSGEKNSGIETVPVTVPRKRPVSA